MSNVYRHLQRAGEQVEIWRPTDRDTRIELQGLVNRKEQRITFEPNANVQEHDIVTLASGKQVVITEAYPHSDGRSGTYGLVAMYEPYGLRNPQSQPSQTHNTIHNYGDNFGSQGNENTINQTFTFEFGTSLDDLESLIHERGGEDTQELLEMVEELRGTIERGESLEPEKLSRWRELLERHASWIIGPSASVITQYAFGLITGS